jgi:hypothetical protein
MNTVRLIASEIIEQTRPAVAMPLVLPRFLATAANAIPTMATIKAGKAGININTKLTIPSTKLATAKPWAGG